MTKHSMEKQDWDAKNKVSKKSYGLDSFRWPSKNQLRSVQENSPIDLY